MSLLDEANAQYQKLNNAEARSLILEYVSNFKGEFSFGVHEAFILAYQNEDFVTMSQLADMLLSKNIPYGYFLQSQIHFLKGEEEAREEYLGKGIEGGDFNSFEKKIEIDIWYGRFVEARKLAEEFVRLFPDDEKALVTYATCLRRCKDFDLAEKTIAPLIDKGNLDAYLELSLIYYEKGDISSARKVNEKMLKVEPENERYLLNMAYICRDLNDLDGYLEFMRRAAELESIEGKVRVGEFLIAQNDFVEAEKYLTSAAKSGDVEALGNLGYIYLRNGDRDGADRLLTRAVDEGAPVRFKLYLAEVRMWHNKNYNAAKALLESVISETNNKSLLGTAYSDLGKYQIDKEIYSEAERNLMQALKLQVPRVEAWLGELYLRQGQKKKAIEWFEKSDLEGDRFARVGLLMSLVDSKDKSKFYYWAERLANEGNALACAILADREAQRGNFVAAESWSNKSKSGWN